MRYHFTPGAERALTEAVRWQRPASDGRIDVPGLLIGLLAEPECRAAGMMAAQGLDQSMVRKRWPEVAPHEPPPSLSPHGASPPPSGKRFTADVENALIAALDRLWAYPQPVELATEHLLLGLAASGHEAGSWLAEHGLDARSLEAEVHRLHGHEPTPIDVPPGDDPPEEVSHTASLPPITTTEYHPVSVHVPRAMSAPISTASPSEVPLERTGLWRAFDASANRAREALRVIEDYARFVLDDRHLTGLLKEARHELTAVLAAAPSEMRLACRETQADVGTTISTAAEQSRPDGASVLAANFARLSESLRSLEEYGKVLLPADVPLRIEQLRYRVYTLERAVAVTRASLERLRAARLYALIDGRASPEELAVLIRALVGAGVHVIQLRDKRLADRELLMRARLVADLTRGTGTLFIMNDRPDLAALSRADGVHVGQSELSVKDARAIVGPGALVGVSTHAIEEARAAVLDGADYLGVGPTFPSGTKSFERFPGLDYVKAVASEIRLPAFAIGGITAANLPQVLAVGGRRVAVSGAIGEAADPARAARELLAMLASRTGVDL